MLRSESAEFKLLGLTHPLAVGLRGFREKRTQTGTRCCELGCLNVTLLLNVPKVQAK